MKIASYNKSIAFLYTLTMLLVPTTITAEQIFLVPRQEVTDFSYRGNQHNFSIPDEVPDNLKSPVNYAEGQLYLYHNVKEKGTKEKIVFQLCIHQGGSDHTCGSYVGVTDPGLYYNDRTLASCWNYGSMNWTTPLRKTKLLIRNSSGTQVEVTYKIKVDFAAVLVAKGDSFEKPSWWDGGPATEVILHRKSGVQYTAAACADQSTGYRAYSIQGRLLGNQTMPSMVANRAPAGVSIISDNTGRHSIVRFAEKK